MIAGQRGEFECFAQIPRMWLTLYFRRKKLNLKLSMLVGISMLLSITPRDVSNILTSVVFMARGQVGQHWNTIRLFLFDSM